MLTTLPTEIMESSQLETGRKESLSANVREIYNQSSRNFN